MKQLFANSAKTTLSSAITTSSTSLLVLDGSTFPSPSTYEYFLCTLESSGSIEIVMITSRVGNTLIIGGMLYSGQTVQGRGQEGTSCQSFSVGTRVECRVTRDTLGRASTSLGPISSVDLLLAPKDSYNHGYITGTLDLYGNPVIAVVKDTNTWRFLSHTSQASSTVTTSSTTSVTATFISLTGALTGRYIIQFTSGALSGQVRQVTSVASNVVTWVGATGSAPSVGVTFELLKSNAAIIADVISIGDDAVIMPLLLGGD